MGNIRQVLNNKMVGNKKTDERHLVFFYLLDYIKKNCKINEVEVQSNIRLEYVGDFYGLLLHSDTSPKLRYINTLLNDLSSSNEYNGVATTIKFLNTDDPKVASIIERVYNTDTTEQ